MANVDIEQIGPCFAGRVKGVELTRPLSDAEVEGIHAGMDEFAVLVIPGCVLSAEQQLARTRQLGEIEKDNNRALRRTKEDKKRKRTALSAAPPVSVMIVDRPVRVTWE